MKTVALVGKTNVGKSTFFNRLVGKKAAIVHDRPGVTRDRKEGKASLGDISFKIIDTAGLEETSDLAKAMWKQTEKAIDDADIVLMMIDTRSELNPLDMRLAALLRGVGKPVFLLANKCEGKEQHFVSQEAYRLGLGDPIAVSGEHGLGMSDLYQALLPYFPEDEEEEEKVSPYDLKVAIVGRPNVGKSTLVNQLLGEDRMLTGPNAGVTRDAITVDLLWKDKKIQLVDTAGMRKQSKVGESLEKISVADARHALNFAEVVIVVVDANNPLESQDLLIARQVVEEGRALVIAVNKWDTISKPKAVMNEIKEKLRTSLQQVKGVPVVTLSALTGQGIDLLMTEAFKIYSVWNKRVKEVKIVMLLEVDI